MPGRGRPEIGRHYRKARLARLLGCAPEEVDAVLDAGVTLGVGGAGSPTAATQEQPPLPGFEHLVAPLDTRVKMEAVGRRKAWRPVGKEHRSGDDAPRGATPRKKVVG